MRKIKVLRHVEPYYRLRDDGVLEELCVSIRRYPKDNKNQASVVVERAKYMQGPRGIVTIGFDANEAPRTEITQLGKSVLPLETVIDNAVRVCRNLASTEGYSTEPPPWFRRGSSQLETIS